MADDAGALLVRSGLVSSGALDDARVRVASNGGTVGEQLVASGAVTDDALTDFYRQRLLVPQVNPNTLARLPVKVIAAIPSDMAIELRVIPVSYDSDNNLTVAMGDPSDRHAVDEIAFFTGAYVVRAVATQMQIAWCLAHYYGHLTALGHQLIQSTQPGVPRPASGEAAKLEEDGGGPERPALRGDGEPVPARTKGLTGRVDAARHRAIAPVTGPVDVARPRSGELDLPPAAPSATASGPVRAASEPELDGNGVPDQPRARSVSGEIRVPPRRAASIKPPIPEPDDDDDHDDGGDESGPVITMEASEPIEMPGEDPTGPRTMPVRRRPAKTDPPELAARAGEVDIGTGPVRRVDLDEPRIIIAEDLEPPAPPPILPETSGELRAVAQREVTAQPSTSIEVDDTSVGVVIHEHYSRESEPVLLDRRRPMSEPTTTTTTTLVLPVEEAPEDGVDDDVVVLDARKPAPPKPVRSEKRTQVGIGALPAVTRAHRDTETSAVPDDIDDEPTGAQRQLDTDPTRVDARAAPPSVDDTTDETIAPPPAPARDDDTSPRIAPPPPGSGRRAVSAPPVRAITAPDAEPDDGDDDDDDDEGDGGRPTAVMTAIELDDVIPRRKAEVVPAHLERNRIDYDPVDDGWGPPGTTIPPPLLGAIPGSEDDDPASAIPMPSVDSLPLIVAPPSPPEATRGSPGMNDGSGGGLVRALEDATSRSIDLIHTLERASDRDAVVNLMIAHLAETHRRAGFFSIKPTATKANELAVFAMQPAAAVLPVAALLLDRPSTLQDVVGTRLPYRGPMHDDASRNFLASVLGACPPEILLVPVTVRERVVGVLFGEHRMRHTFDDQLALAARAAGMALERVLKAKRG